MESELGYNDKLDSKTQVDAEEMIASMIFDCYQEYEERLCEEGCAQLGRDILLRVLAEFRSDLVE